MAAGSAVFWPSRGLCPLPFRGGQTGQHGDFVGTYREDPGAAAPPSAILGSPGQTQQRWAAPVHLLGYFRPRGWVVRRGRRESRTEPVFPGAPVRDGSAASRVSALCSLAWAKDEGAAQSLPWWARLPRGTSLPGPERTPHPAAGPGPSARAASRPTSGGPYHLTKAAPKASAHWQGGLLRGLRAESRPQGAPL